jgi:hypothetical protein
VEVIKKDFEWKIEDLFLKFCRTRERKFQGKSLPYAEKAISVKGAPMPYDILWENLNFTKGHQIVNKIMSYFILIVLCGLSGLFCYLIRQTQVTSLLIRSNNCSGR